MIFHLGCLLSQLKSPTTRKTSDMQGIHLKMTDIVILVPLFAPTKTQTIMVQTESLQLLWHHIVIWFTWLIQVVLLDFNL